MGVTLRVTPQITEGDSVRLEIFQEITEVTESAAGNVEDVGVTLRSRTVENTVVVRDGETIAIGGLLSNTVTETVTKVPWLGDIPILGWLFKNTTDRDSKVNLLVFLTPRIVRTPLDLEHETIRRREEFRDKSGTALELSERETEREAERLAMAEEAGLPYEPDHYDHPVRERLAGHRARYPVERLAEIEQERAARREAAAQSAGTQRSFLLQAAVLGDADAAAQLLTDLIDSGYEGDLIAAPVGESVLYEIRLGPFSELDEARLVGEAVQRSHGLTPSVLVLEEATAEEGPGGDDDG